MPRTSRKRKNSESVEMDDLKKKFIKLEKMLSGFCRKRVIYSSSDSDSSDEDTPLRHRDRSCSQSLQRSVSPSPAPSTSRDGQLPASSDVEMQPSCSATGVVKNPVAPPPPSSVPGPSGINTDTIADNMGPDNEFELTDDILEILGEDPSIIKSFGKDIQKDIAIRFQHIATNGLNKEHRQELKERYPIPANCTLIDAPEVNPEMKAAISDIVAKRLRGMELKQKKIASAISCIGEAATLLLARKEKDSDLLKLLMDGGRMLCDIQFSESLTRRGFILSALKKEMKDQLLLTKIDSSLFGKDLSETLKTAKAVNKSGAELKITNTPAKRPPITKNAPTKNNLNWRAPPSNRRSTRTPRMQRPAPRTQRSNSSKISQARHSSKKRRQ